MSDLTRIADEERESKFGYVHAVSGPGKDLLFSLVFFSLTLFTFFSSRYR